MMGRFRSLIASTGLLLIMAVSVRAQTISRETGSVTVGGYLVWVRGTNAHVVELYVGRGFRDAFARSHDMDAARLQQWIDSVRAASSVPAEDSIASDSLLRGASLGADVTMARRVGGSFSGLRLLVNGEGPIRMAESTARDFIAMLDSAARVTRELSAPPPLVVASTLSPAPAAPAVSAPPPAPARAITASTVETLPDPVLRAPSEPVAALASSSTIARLPTPALAAYSSTIVAPVAPPARDTIVAAPTVPVLPAPPHTDVPSDKLIRTPLGPFTVPGALLSDRDKQAQYCYTQLGLKYNPELKGEITVKLSVRTDGAVQDAVVTKRSWQGISAGEVESCVRALAHDWTFASTDPAVTNGAKLLTFSFAP